jgi:DNA repair protein RecO (recombination protein O)
VEAAFVLHTRPWRETSVLAELFTAEHGRLGVVARGVRRGRRGGSSPLRPFVALRCLWRGRGELRTLTTAEPERPFVLVGDALFGGLYLNELLVRLLQREDAHPELFLAYARAVAALAGPAPALEPVLRRFEFGLLEELGYGFPLDLDATGRPVRADARYRFEAEAGLLPVEGVEEGGGPGRGFPGAALLALAAGDFDEAETRRVAKRLARQALAPHLGDRPLHARALFSGR